jgi:predicted RNA-binding protein with PIN domain
VAYLIDGNNFLGYIFPGSFRDPREKYSLIGRLLCFQRIKKARVFVVFDGPPDSWLEDERFKKHKFSIVYPPRGDAADSVIKKIISEQTDLRKFFVVSSDRDLKIFAKAAGAKTLSCAEFNKELKKILREHRKEKEIEKKENSLSSLELNLWLDVFKNKK